MKILSSLMRPKSKAATSPRRAMLERMTACTVHGWACLPAATANDERIEIR